MERETVSLENELGTSDDEDALKQSSVAISENLPGVVQSENGDSDGNGRYEKITDKTKSRRPREPSSAAEFYDSSDEEVCCFIFLFTIESLMCIQFVLDFVIV